MNLITKPTIAAEPASAKKKGKVKKNKAQPASNVRIDGKDYKQPGQPADNRNQNHGNEIRA